MSVWLVTTTKIINGKVHTIREQEVWMRRRITNDFHRNRNAAYQQDREGQRQYITACYLGTTQEQTAIRKRRTEARNLYGSSGIRMSKRARLAEAARELATHELLRQARSGY